MRRGEPRRRARAALYLRARAVYDRLAAGADALWTGFWLGLLDPPDMHAVDEALYEHWSMYRSEEHNRRGLIDWEARAIREHFPQRGSVLLIGAGGGREVLALSALGYQVDGYECNPALLAFAQRMLQTPSAAARELSTVKLLERDRAPSEGGPYDAAIVGWSAYMLIPGRERRAALLAGLRARMKAGAPLLLSFFTRPAGERSPRQRIVLTLANALRRMRRAEAAEAGDDLAPNYVHRFTEAEMAAELAAAGFTLAHFEPQGAGPTASGWAVGVA